MTTKSSSKRSSKQRAPKSAPTATTSPAAAPVPVPDERIAYLTGRVLRDTDDEAFKAFVDLLADMTDQPALGAEVLACCELTARLRDRQRARAAALPAIDYEPVIMAHEAEIAARTSVAARAPECRVARAVRGVPHARRLLRRRIGARRHAGRHT